MKQTKIYSLVSSAFLGMLLTACGGGGSNAPTTPLPPDLSIRAAASGEVGAPANFDSSASALSGLSYQWNFGDGKTSTEAAPKHDYTQGGDYDVSLKVSNSSGEFKEVSYRVIVNNRKHVSGLNCSQPSGFGWCDLQQPKAMPLEAPNLFFLDANLGWAVYDTGEIFSTPDGAKSWTKLPNAPADVQGTKFKDALNGWAWTGSFESIELKFYKTSDGGLNWVYQDSAPSLAGC